jgi:hypothetical protein
MTTATPLARQSIPIWTLRREAGLNWLALGLLLAAWNGAYNEVPDRGGAKPRPDALRGYPSVSVRAIRHLSVKGG